MTETQPATPPRKFPATKTARLARARLERLLEGAGDDTKLWAKVQTRVPDAWATLEEDIDCWESKVKITLRLDTSVARFYRAMGKGYQARMNRILSTYAQMRIGEVERMRAAEDRVDAIMRENLPEAMGEHWRKYRDEYLAGDGPDLSWMDRIYGDGGDGDGGQGDEE